MYGVVLTVVALFPALIVLHGSDALSICMNALAIIFVLQLDNQLYDHGMPTHIKHDFEEDEYARVVLRTTRGKHDGDGKHDLDDHTYLLWVSRSRQSASLHCTYWVASAPSRRYPVC